jgi:hypothetical protein
MVFLIYLIGLLFIGVVALFVASPLFRMVSHDTSARTGTDNSVLLRWEKQKMDAYAAIKEAEFDHQMGKLTEEDYRFLREKYEARAFEALAHLDRANKT